LADPAMMLSPRGLQKVGREPRRRGRVLAARGRRQDLVPTDEFEEACRVVSFQERRLRPGSAGRDGPAQGEKRIRKGVVGRGVCGRHWAASMAWYGYPEKCRNNCLFLRHSAGFFLH